MTPDERRHPKVLESESRQTRIACDSGRPVEEVTKLLQRYKDWRNTQDRW
jgi:signal recognition particle GTPase